MATAPCPTCDYIAATFANQIAAGDVYRCSTCGRVVAAAPPAAAPPTAAPGAGPRKSGEGTIAAVVIGALAAAWYGCGGDAPRPAVTPPPPAQSTPAVNPSGSGAPPAGGWNPSEQPGRRNPAALLVGSWRWDGGGGYSSTFAFDANGAFTYYAAGANPLLNLPVAGYSAYDRWSVRGGTLFVEFTGASDPALVPLFRGRAARSPVQFGGENAVQLFGIEGDEVTRTYACVR